MHVNNVQESSASTLKKCSYAINNLQVLKASETKALAKKLETSQQAMERKTLNIKLQDRIQNTITRQTSCVLDIAEY